MSWVFHLMKMELTERMALGIGKPFLDKEQKKKGQ